MSVFVFIVVAFLVGLFGSLSLLPATFNEADKESLVQQQD
jgi:hypothetical protein